LHRGSVSTACEPLKDGAQKKGLSALAFHRTEKADTKGALESLASLKNIGVPYTMLSHESAIPARPFASRRDSISGLHANCAESPVDEFLLTASVSIRKTKRAERAVGLEQRPNYFVPGEYNPRVVIEAKIAEDDGTTRDKVTRIQHLATLSDHRVRTGREGFDVIACIDGRGFGIRREDMKKVIRATRGKVFTLATLDRLVQSTSLKEFRTT
jgi:hypothetical protein